MRLETEGDRDAEAAMASLTSEEVAPAATEHERVHAKTTHVDDIPNLSVNNFFLGLILSYPRAMITFVLVKSFDPSQMQLVSTALYFPWMLKIVYALAVDSGRALPQTFLNVSLPISAIAWGAMALANDNRVLLGLFSFTTLCVAIADVALDSIMVKRGKFHANAQIVQSASFQMRIAGMVVGSIAGGEMYGRGGSGLVIGTSFMITMGFWAVSFLLGNVIGREVGHADARRSPENNTPERIMVSTTIGARIRNLFTPEITRIFAFSFVLHAIPSCDGFWDYFAIETMRFSPTAIGILDMIGCIALMMGATLYRHIHERVRATTILIFSLFCLSVDASFITVVQLKRINLAWGIPDGIWAIGDAVFGSVASEMLAMPIQGMIIPMCPDGYEATAFAIFTNLCNVGTMLSAGSGVLFADQLGINEDNMENLWIPYVTRAGVYIVCATFVRWAFAGSGGKGSRGG